MTAEPQPTKDGTCRRVLICGSRDFVNYSYMRRVLETHLRSSDIVVHGDCRGADKMADKIARELGHTTVAYPANWGQQGRKAGPVRNQMMLDMEKPTLVLAFPIGRSPGTRDMIVRARHAGAEVIECRLEFEAISHRKENDA